MKIDLGDLTIELTEGAMALRRKGNAHQFFALSAWNWYELSERIETEFGRRGPWPVTQRDRFSSSEGGPE